MAGPLRFRRSEERWDEPRVRRELLAPLDEKFGASLGTPWFGLDRYETRRLEMANGDFALFAWREPRSVSGGSSSAERSRRTSETSASPETRRVSEDSAGRSSGRRPREDGEQRDPRGEHAFWLGNTETPEALWRTEKYDFSEVPAAVSAWAERELLARLEAVDPWLADYEHLARFFLPVFHSKDGRHTTRAFFRDHAAGFPDADRDDALRFFDDTLATGVLDDHRYTMAAKLGTSEGLDVGRMSATMSEFVAARILADAGLSFEPEIELDSGYALDFRVGDSLVEVTRPLPPTERDRADTPAAAVNETAGTKADGQLSAHPGATLFVDCSSFTDGQWAAVRGERPDPGYRPTAVYRARPSGKVEGYRVGTIPFDLDGAIDWADE